MTLNVNDDAIKELDGIASEYHLRTCSEMLDWKFNINEAHAGIRSMGDFDLWFSKKRNDLLDVLPHKNSPDPNKARLYSEFKIYDSLYTLFKSGAEGGFIKFSKTLRWAKIEAFREGLYYRIDAMAKSKGRSIFTIAADNPRSEEEIAAEHAIAKIYFNFDKAGGFQIAKNLEMEQTLADFSEPQM